MLRQERTLLWPPPIPKSPTPGRLDFRPAIRDPINLLVMETHKKRLQVQGSDSVDFIQHSVNGDASLIKASRMTLRHRVPHRQQ